MTATYTPEVAAARSTLGDATFLIEAFSGQHYTQARDYLRLLLDDHARLAEEAEKLKDRVTNRDAALVVQEGQRIMGLAALRTEHVRQTAKLRRVAEAAKALTLLGGKQ